MLAHSFAAKLLKAERKKHALLLWTHVIMRERVPILGAALT